MKFKKFRYNLILLGLVAIIGCFIALPLVTGGQNDVNQGTIVDGAEDDPFEDFVDNSQSEEDPDDDEEDEDREDFASIASASDALSYALNKLYNGAGFKCNFSQSLTNTAVSFGITVPQNIVGSITKNGKESLQESYFYSDYSGMGGGQVKNYYQYFYSVKNENFKTGLTSSYNWKDRSHDLSKGSVEEMSYAEGIERYVILYGDKFPVVGYKKGDTATNDEVVKTNKGSYRQITVSYALKNIPESFKNYYGSTGQLRNINYSSLTITYKINQSNGNMMSIMVAEKLSGVGSEGGMDAAVAMDSKLTLSFTEVDKAQTIKIPQ